MSNPQTTKSMTGLSSLDEGKGGGYPNGPTMEINNQTTEPYYDAVLKNAVFVGKHIEGNIYGDKKGRFEDGTWVHTSPLSHGHNLEIYHTRNSIYKVEFAHDR